ncbi:hypothetical protein [Desulfatibacillum alkenivorans]|jgi:hypothetical protein|uniref:hypothetical protein n=1 Tax=Desulfatibacillum alkenivorans TaxID=259354 RepID=UPI000937AF21|nr:hypothetical protein [Desulfatibacillum alkenivorans]
MPSQLPFQMLVIIGLGCSAFGYIDSDFKWTLISGICLTAIGHFGSFLLGQKEAKNQEIRYTQKIDELQLSLEELTEMNAEGIKKHVSAQVSKNRPRPIPSGKHPDHLVSKNQQRAVRGR